MNHIPIWKKENDSLFLKNFRRRSDIYQITCANHKTEFNEFLSILRGLQKEYPHILDGIELTSNAHTYLYDAAQESEEFECGVCFDFYSVSKRVMCGKANGGKRHQFCIECVRQQANVATGEMPLAEGAVGLKCMDGDCNNPIYYGLFSLTNNF
uniref:RING-type domain-containing protein n=1 Tax=Panagrolaimus sp. JU765 TaxID=591449 RepID=A0AC34QE35_9BILA